MPDTQLQPGAQTTPESTKGSVCGTLALIGLGLIGSSIARSVRHEGLARDIICIDSSESVCREAETLGLGETIGSDPALVADADIVILCMPVGAYVPVMETIAPHLKPGAIVTDVGSVKQLVVDEVAPLVPAGIHLVPGHPIAGTEKSGPSAGFRELFHGRYAVLTPLDGGDPNATATVRALWEGMGSTVEIMTPKHHDMVLAITSHLPHLIAYTIVGTATDLEAQTKDEVIRFSASGFRDFTRIAASDPIMWRDIFLNNREAVLEMLQRFSEDLTTLQRAIRWGEGATLEELFRRTRDIRRGVVDANQA